MRIFLTGFMAAGKTTVGRLLAGRTGLPFVDLDAEIEHRAGDRIAAIFEQNGEETFRRLESEALASAASLEDVVVATGGGTMLAAGNRRLMRRAGVTVWLDPPFEVLSARLRQGGRRLRPLYRDADQARDLLRARRAAYGQADLRVEIGAEEAPDEVASRILGLLSEAPCVT